jgi:hypothetical protein
MSESEIVTGGEIAGLIIGIPFLAFILRLMAFMTEFCLLPALLNISKNYGISKDMTGCLLALGN